MNSENQIVAKMANIINDDVFLEIDCYPRSPSEVNIWKAEITNQYKGQRRITGYGDTINEALSELLKRLQAIQQDKLDD